MLTTYHLELKYRFIRTKVSVIGSLICLLNFTLCTSYFNSLYFSIRQFIDSFTTRVLRVVKGSSERVEGVLE